MLRDELFDNTQHAHHYRLADGEGTLDDSYDCLEGARNGAHNRSAVLLKEGQYDTAPYLLCYPQNCVETFLGHTYNLPEYTLQACQHWRCGNLSSLQPIYQR